MRQFFISFVTTIRRWWGNFFGHSSRPLEKSVVDVRLVVDSSPTDILPSTDESKLPFEEQKSYKIEDGVNIPTNEIDRQNPVLSVNEKEREVIQTIDDPPLLKPQLLDVSKGGGDLTEIELPRSCGSVSDNFDQHISDMNPITDLDVADFKEHPFDKQGANITLESNELNQISDTEDHHVKPNKKQGLEWSIGVEDDSSSGSEHLNGTESSIRSEHPDNIPTYEKSIDEIIDDKENEQVTLPVISAEETVNIPETVDRKRTLRRHPPKYQGRSGKPPTFFKTYSAKRNQRATVCQDVPAPIDIQIRILFKRDYCNVTLLAKRTQRLPGQITLKSDNGEIQLTARGDEWYEDFVPENLGNILREGNIWMHEDTCQVWSISSGRGIYVLAPNCHRGYVSCTRLVLGREHVILCSTLTFLAVERALQESGCSNWTQFGEDNGAPGGWLVLRGVVPQYPVKLSDKADPLNVLRPLPDIEISLEGGIRLTYNSWLYRFPPVVRVYGKLEHIDKVLIDGQEAVGSNECGYIVEGWDEVGDHQVWCSNMSKSYSLVKCELNDKFWPAQTLYFSNNRNETYGYEFCGPLVRPISDPQSVEPKHVDVYLVPSINPVLLGSKPGQVFLAKPRYDIRGTQCLVSPPFKPVWALPFLPLRCKKSTNRIILIGEPLSVRDGEELGQWQCKKSDIEQWYRFILDCCRKKLAVEPANHATLWYEYRSYAKRLWRCKR